jgi:hypothetical protein
MSCSRNVMDGLKFRVGRGGGWGWGGAGAKDHCSTAWTEAKSTLIIANTGGAVGDATGDDDESVAAQWRKAALLNDMAVSEGWWAEQCSWLTMTLYDGPAVLWMLKDPLSTDSTPDNHGLDTYLKCVTCQMSAITKTMNEKKRQKWQHHATSSWPAPCISWYSTLACQWLGDSFTGTLKRDKCQEMA